MSIPAYTRARALAVAHAASIVWFVTSRSGSAEPLYQFVHQKEAVVEVLVVN